VPPAGRSSRLKQLVRRLARPVTSSIDGRVADINRRVTEAARRVERLEVAVGSFAEASTEATSYVGIELGRIAGSVDGLERSMHDLSASAREEHYRRRLADAVRLPLEQLDGDLAALINFAAGHRGFAAQADLWFNPPVTVELSEGRAHIGASNERIVEVPFAMMALGRVDSGSRILDVGSAESTFPLSAASLGYQVTAVDPRGLPYDHPNLETVAARFEDLPTPQEPYAAVFLVSTIEHVGLPAYGVQPRGEVHPGLGADREMLAHVRELLSDDGIVVVTTPYGTRQVTDFERTYDDDALASLLVGWEVLQRAVVARRDPSVWENAFEGESVDGGGVVMVVAKPTPG
jgi:2-polyprenyl-3-methyl-5-hydroxy-6-metoxy-1,4-benzoquinol methylase